MKGLLLKDFYMIRKHCNMYLLIDVVFIAVSFFSNSNIMFVALPIMLGGVIPITLLAYDERSHWTEYCGALPYSRAQIVSAKYLVGLIIQTATSFVILIVLLIRNNAFTYSGFGETLCSVAAMFIAALILPMICMPFSLKFGTEKGRLVYYVVIVAITGSIVLSMESTDDIPHKLTSNAEFVPLIFIGLLVLYSMSWILSIVLYNYKEVGK